MTNFLMEVSCGYAVTMKNLSNELLIETYFKAIELKLSSEFVFLVKEELGRRSLLAKIKKTS